MLAKAYHELQDRQQKEINDFPMAFAFSDEQLQEALKKLDADISECCTYMQIGDVVRKKDVPALREMLKRHKQETYDFLKGDKEDIYEAFLYEMDNHEYAINWEGDAEVLGCFCLTPKMLNEMGLEDIYRRARNAHMKHAQEWDMI